jgi:hypothetical protein
MDYADVLKRAWGITWKNKGLWILGILAACTGGGGGGGGSSSYQSSGYRVSGDEFPGLQRFFDNIPEETLILIAVAVGVIILLLVLAFLVLGILGQAGLIAGVSHADEAGSVTLAEAWRLGRPHFWRLLGAGLLVFGVAIALAFIVGIPLALFAGLTLGLGVLCILPLVCLAIPIALLANIYITFVQNSIVLEGTPVMSSFRRAWEVFRANIGTAIVMGLILLVGGFIAGLIIAAPLIAVALPALLAFSLGGEQGVQTGTLVAVACGLVYLPVMVLLNGILQTFVSGSWTLTYRRLIAKGGPIVPSVPVAS